MLKNKVLTNVILNDMTLRPEIHFTAPFGWINDPNGLMYHDGIYHLFYQYYPFAAIHGPMHWGHAVSINLLDWSDMPPAFIPTDYQYFSGSAFYDIHRKQFIAFYTAHVAGSGYDHDKTDFEQYQMIATSEDAITWPKSQQSVVLKNTNPRIQDFRDPKVFWYAPKQTYIMLITHGQTIGFYESKDQHHWTYLSEFGAQEGAHDEMAWECPDLIEMTYQNDSIWVLTVGVQKCANGGGSGTQYFIGQFTGQAFINANSPSTVLWLDMGRDFYAAQSFSGLAKKAPCVIAWMSNWYYAKALPTEAYIGMMSAARVLYLSKTAKGMRVFHRFAPTWVDLLQVEHTLSEMVLGECCIQTSKSAQLITLHLNLQNKDRLTIIPFESELFKQSVMRYLFEYNEGVLSMTVCREIDKHTNIYFSSSVTSRIMSGSEITLEILKDRTSLEILVNQGELSSTDICFPPDWAPLQIRKISGKPILLGGRVCSRQ